MIIGVFGVFVCGIIMVMLAVFESWPQQQKPQEPPPLTRLEELDAEMMRMIGIR